RLLEAERSARGEAEAHAASLRLRERHLTLLHNVTRATTGLQVEEMLQTVVNRLGELSDARACYVTLWDEVQQQVVPVAAYGPWRETYASYQVLPGESTLTRSALEAGRSIQVSGNGDEIVLSPRIAADFGREAALAIPLLTGSERLGALILAHEQAYDFSPSEVALYEQAASQIALALSAARLFEETKRQLEELKLLHSLATAGAEAENEDALLEHATELMKESLFPDNFGVLLYDEEEQVLYRHDTYHSGQHERKDVHIPLGVGICGHVAQFGQPVRSGDVSKDERYVEADPLTKSELCVPLKTGAHLIGVVNVESRNLNAYSDLHERLLSTFANQLATAIEKLRLFARTQANLTETQALYQVSRSLIAAEDLPALLQAVVNSVSQALPADRTVLVTVDLPTRQVIDYVLDDLGDLHMPRVTFDDLWQGLSGWVLRKQKPLLSPKGQLDERESKLMRQRREEAGAGAIIVVPLRYREKTLGTITAINRREGPDFTQRNVELMLAMANQAAVAIENARLFAETRRRAEELEVLGNLSASLRVADGAEEITASLLSASAELFNAEVVAIMVPGEEPGTLVLAHSVGVPDSMQDVVYKIDNSVAGRVLNSGKPQRVNNMTEAAHNGNLSQVIWKDLPLRIQTAIYAPLQAGSQVTGVVAVMTSANQILEEDDLGLLSAMAEITGSALHRAGLMETLEQRVAERTRELAEANVRLQELDRLKSKFVSDVSHELRTPITSLSLYLDLIERAGPERSERYWTVLRKQTERLNQLIEDILSLSRLQMGKVDVSLAPVDLNELVAEMLDVRRDEFAKAGLKLELELDRALPAVSAQPDLLAQVIDNLLSNAVNYTTEGAVQIGTSQDRESKRACFFVADSGIGINGDDLPHIFERFYRGQYAGQSNIPGTGLGLTIVEEIVHLHNGQIEVLSEEGKGTTFRVWLPLEGST
ncbi:MAG TPA: GAF domain-containing protein, partial [Candidatus Binatia bacterium]|nr:GAF domain-containing protein [Candidatus Binatia bacterium]